MQFVPWQLEKANLQPPPIFHHHQSVLSIALLSKHTPSSPFTCFDQSDSWTPIFFQWVIFHCGKRDLIVVISDEWDTWGKALKRDFNFLLLQFMLFNRSSTYSFKKKKKIKWKNKSWEEIFFGNSRGTMSCHVLDKMSPPHVLFLI